MSSLNLLDFVVHFNSVFKQSVDTAWKCEEREKYVDSIENSQIYFPICCLFCSVCSLMHHRWLVQLLTGAHLICIIDYIHLTPIYLALKLNAHWQAENIYLKKQSQEGFVCFYLDNTDHTPFNFFWTAVQQKYLNKRARGCKSKFNLSKIINITSYILQLK